MVSQEATGQIATLRSIREVVRLLNLHVVVHHGSESFPAVLKLLGEESDPRAFVDWVEFHRDGVTLCYREGTVVESSWAEVLDEVSVDD